jgi:D-alanine-D-alanine ligase
MVEGSEKTSKLNVVVLMGGQTAEHEVSLASGRMIVQALDRRRYNVKPVTITREGQWLIPSGYLTLDGPDENASETALSMGSAIQRTRQDGIDVVFLALHGPLGEDGSIQGLIELADIPYTGSGVLASALAMHKARSLQVFQSAGLAVACYRAFDRWQWERRSGEILEEIEAALGIPCVVLPVELGSSVGVTIVRNREALTDAIDQALSYGNEVLIEEYLDGEEVTCGVLGNDPGLEPVALVPTQIIPKQRDFFDYEAKYTPGASEEITPPVLPESLIREIQRVAIVAHKALGCAGLSRSDMRIRNGTVYILETNTLPGMTPTSLFPQGAAAAGMSFPRMVDRLIELALAYHQIKRRKVTRQ